MSAYRSAKPLGHVEQRGCVSHLSWNLTAEHRVEQRLNREASQAPVHARSGWSPQASSACLNQPEVEADSKTQARTAGLQQPTLGQRLRDEVELPLFAMQPGRLVDPPAPLRILSPLKLHLGARAGKQHQRLQIRG